MKISVVINTFNAERCLDSVLQSVDGYDEIVVCDMHSNDKTVEIANKYNCKIVYHEHTGIVEPAREYAISQASNDWILVVDADECIPSVLKDYLIDVVKNNPNVAAVRIPRRNYFMGRFMRGSYPDHITRFVNKQKVKWPSQIHTRPIISGDVFVVPPKRKDLAFIHYGDQNLFERAKKVNNYTEFEIKRRLKRSNGVFSLLIGSFIRFFRSYISKGGFRDGMPGLIWAMDTAIYKFMAISKTIEVTMKIDDYDPLFREHFEEDLQKEISSRQNKIDELP